MKKKKQYFLEYAAFRFIETCIRLTPVFLLELVAKGLAYVAFNWIQYRRRVALENLAIAFPEKPMVERLEIAHGSIRHFILVILEFMKFNRWSYKKLERKVDIEPPEDFDIIVENNRENGMILVGGHFGNWEIPIAFLSEGYFPNVSIIQQRQKNPLVDEYLTSIRAKRGMKIYYTGDAIKNATEDLKNNSLVAIVCDQDAGARGIWIPFFGKMASTHVGASLLHLNSQAKLMFGACVRTGRFKFKTFLVPVNYQGEYTESRENMQQVTRAFTVALEEAIRQYPEQYLWTHRRWKTKYDPNNPAHRFSE